MSLLRAAVMLGPLCAVEIAAALPAPKPVEALEVAAFAGRWYQTYGSISVKYATELGASCVYVEYEANVPNSSALSVRNSVSVFGLRVDVTGYATPNPDRAGEFEVALGPPGHPPAHPASFTAANFIVVALGPMVNKLYDFAVITDPTLLSLYVLTRDVDRFRSRYESKVLNMVKEMGFNSLLNRPLRTNQDGCHYPSASVEDPIVLV